MQRAWGFFIIIVAPDNRFGTTTFPVRGSFDDWATSGGFWRDFRFVRSISRDTVLLYHSRILLIPMHPTLTDDQRQALNAVGGEFSLRAAYPIQNAVVTGAGWNDPRMDDYDRLSVPPRAP